MAPVSSALSLERRLAALLIEQAPFAVENTLRAFESARDGGNDDGTAVYIEALRPILRHKITETWVIPKGSFDFEVRPGTQGGAALSEALQSLLELTDAFLDRERIARGIQNEERLEILRGMILTRAVDSQLKRFFMGGDVRFEQTSFQGKGFRSLGQEAIYAAALRLRRGDRWHDDNGWQGDVVAPLIRDAGVALAMTNDDDTIYRILNAQMGKAGPPMDGRDLHYGDLARGILPAAAPLSISTATCAGLAMAFALNGERRVAFSFIGEGGCSLGEWHEAINLCAARRLPAVFCVQNNQTALSTPVGDQSAVRVFADKAAGYGIPGVTLDGTDPEAIAAAFGWAADRARSGAGPALIELVSMRMCGHAHHDDMLYLGHDPPPSRNYSALKPQGYADAERYAFWSARDPIHRYAAELSERGLLQEDDLDRLHNEAESRVRAQAERVIAADWPDPSTVGSGVFAGEPPRQHTDPLADPLQRIQSATSPGKPSPARLTAEPGAEFSPRGSTFLDAIMRGIGDALDADPRVFVYGQDVGGRYGNAFLLLRPLLEKFGDRIINSTLAEGGVLGVCVGAALAGRRPIGEIQFNDFVATGFNQLVNNAAKTRYRWGGEVPMVVRMPWGGLRKAGPYHSQNTEPWFYRTPGLKIVCPSTPADARALMASAVADPDPVLYYEHIALYRDPKIKQILDDAAPTPIPLGKAALRREGDELALISYGAYVHVCTRVADRLAEEGRSVAVLDLRSLAPLDREMLLALSRHCGKVMLVHEDSRTGGIGESLAAVIQEEAFEALDAPIRILGSLDTPVPYSPPLERAFLVQEADVEREARRLLDY